MNTNEVINKLFVNVKYNISVDKDGEVDGFIIRTLANPLLGFNFGYLMYLPLELRPLPVLLVEGPSVGEVGPIEKACQIIYDRALFELSTGGYPHNWAKNVGCPIIMPLFPRPEDKANNNIFTHDLTSAAMAIKNSPIERIDLQMINMFNEIRNRFATCGIQLYEKFIVKGFSAGGAFAHRFTLLHSEVVLAVISGGCHPSSLPLKTYKDELLLWPNGMGNMKQYSDFNFDEYKRVKQFYYMGDKDYNDSSSYCDSYTQEERDQLYRLEGKIAMPDRWLEYQKIIKELELNNITFMTCKDIAHLRGSEACKYIPKYIDEIINSIS
jgi:hypothetical protein